MKKIIIGVSSLLMTLTVANALAGGRVKVPKKPTALNSRTVKEAGAVKNSNNMRIKTERTQEQFR